MNTGISFQLRLLEQIAIYRFLTPSQFQLIWIDMTIKTLLKNLNSLRERRMCEKTTYRYSPSYGRKENVWHLLPKGKEYLMKYSEIEESDIKMPIGKVKQIEEYEHRKMTISVHIAIRKACDQFQVSLEFFNYDFERRKKISGRGVEWATKIKVWSGFLKSDAVFMMNAQWEHHLYCLEVHNWYRVNRIVKQMKPYAYALAEWSPATKYGVDKSPRILIAFEKESTMCAALEITSQDTFYLYMREYFLFKSSKDILSEPLSWWINLKKEQVNLLPSNPNKNEN